jgi:DHA1 family bicyclomycin/chloramphenicol resistance-like MFS transporter
MLVLGALAAFGPLSTDMYLPALPSMTRALGVSSSLLELTLSVSVLGLGIGQLFAGPISDAVGRRRPMLLGLLAYIAASAVCAAVSSIWPFLVMRFVQGLAGACGIAIGRAVIRDRCSGVVAARAYAGLMFVAGLGPIVAPIAGGLLLHVTDWRGIFLALALIGGAVLSGAVAFVPESLPPARRDAGGLAGVREAFGVLARDRRYLGHSLASALGFGALFAYISASPFVLERIHGLSAQEFSLVFALNGAGLMVARQISTARLRVNSPESVLRAGLAVQGVAGAGVLATVVLGLGLAPLLVCLFIAAASIGAIMPMATALAMEDHPERAGSASGVLGFLQFAIGSAVAPLVGVAGPRSALPLAVAMPVCTLLAVLALRLASGRAPAIVTASATGVD